MRFQPLDILAVVAAEGHVRGHYLLTLRKLRRVFLKLPRFMASKSATGSRPSEPETSTRCILNGSGRCGAENRGRDRRPRKAPSIIPGISAITNERPHRRTHNAEVRKQCCKVVVCDLRVRPADNREQGGFADVREADETHIGKKLKLKRYIVRLAGETRLCKTGTCLVGAAKCCCPSRLAAASRNKVLLSGAVFCKIMPPVSVLSRMRVPRERGYGPPPSRLPEQR